MNFEQLFQQALVHRSEHNCSAYPYENGENLASYVSKYKPNHILEIGTGIGYTTAIIALAAPHADILTLEKDSEHAQAAKIFLDHNKVGDRVKIINESAEEYLQTLNAVYDYIFFDGYQIHYEFLPHYERLLKPGGILFLANNHLKSKTSAQFFEELQDETKWKILERFAETTVAQRI